MKTYYEIATIISHIEFKPWEIYLSPVNDHEIWLQIRAKNDINNATGESGYEWHGRKWRLSFHMTETEIVKTALLAVKIAMEHEVLEKFKYHGVSIFDPHIKVDDLIKLREDSDLDGRS